MSEHNKPQENPHESPEPYTPASPVKRTLAWIGLCYMLILLTLTTYFYFTATMLGNLQHLLILPGLIGAGVLLVVRHRTEGQPSKAVAYGGAALCWLMALVTIPLAWMGLMSNFGG